MSKRLPPLLALQAFEAAARYENFATAAEELNLSQSTVSHRVRGLEQHLGYSLFERLPRGLRLTESAKAYLPTVRRAFEEILGATTGVFGQGGRDILNIRAPISYTVLWLTKLIDQFQNEYPQIEVQLTSTIWAHKTANAEADVEFRIGQGSWPDSDTQFLFCDSLVAVCSPQTAARLGSDPDPAQIAEQPLLYIMSSEDSWGRFFGRSGIERNRNQNDIRVDSSLAAIEQACASYRIALIQDRFADPYICMGRLVQLSQEPLEASEGIYMLKPRDTGLKRPEAILFEKWILERIATQQI